MDRRFPLLAASFLAGAVLMGCGGSGSTGTVTGTVKVDGQIVPVGTVNFFGKDGKSGSGSIQPDGTYKVADAPIGPNKVTVATPLPRPANAPKSLMKEDNVKPVPVPAQYSDREKTDLTVEVKGGTQTFDINLKK